MKIIAGAASAKIMKYFLSHGAGEIYCGLSGIDNHREQPAFSFSDIAQVYEAIDMAHSFKKKISLAINENYHPDKYPLIGKCLEALLGRGLDGVIIKDIFLLTHLNKIGLKTKFILSSLGQCFNSQALAFYRQYGISRVVIPQHMTAREARELVLNKFKIETECFFLPKCCCRNVDGLCRFHQLIHMTKSLPCEMELLRGGRNVSMFRPSEEFRTGLFYDFYKMGIPYLKISRSNPGYMIDCFRSAVDLLDLLGQKDMTRSTFMMKAARLKRD